MPLKVKIFLWFFKRGVILTKDNLAKINWKGRRICEFCSKQETIQHLFFKCHYAKFLWRAVHCIFGLTPPKNLHQGDPLSPYLFLFVAEALSVLLHNKVVQGDIEELRVTRNAPGVSHLLFADDSLLFVKADLGQVTRVQELLGRFQKGTGQLISVPKCSVLMREETDQNLTEVIRTKLGLERIDFEAKYLGLPTPEGRMKSQRFQPLRERLGKRISSWSEKFLSAAGKEVLIKAVAQAIPTYTMSVFQLSASFCEELTKYIRNYWWGDEKDGRKAHWIAWDKFTRSKGRGGLGFRDLQIFNQALLARQAWRLVEFLQSLCARILKARYFPNGDLLDTAFPAQVSPTWRAIMHGLELLKKGAIWRIGCGNLVKIWRYNWIPRGRSLRPIGKRRSCRLKWVEQLIDRDRRRWDESMLERYFFPNDVEEIMKIRLPTSEQEDHVAWHYERSGCFTVRSAYRLGMELKDIEKGNDTSSSSTGSERPIWKMFWKLPVPQKVKVFAWRAVLDGFGTQQKKERRNIVMSDACEICGNGTESVHHALIRCEHAKHLRGAMRKAWRLPTEGLLVESGPEWIL
ncbi:hypothetical protein U9M48_007926 [Paspalum notatum var. saurae]|uniref:Reverse transcriptase zinc-binding domain-containing protein n=1 Tax=Paspalum notatum var. saurae TaxID=547442 RepID=A0AAQ3SN53_PASNO